MAVKSGLRLSASELKLMQHLATTVLRGAESATEKRTAGRLIAWGIVEKDTDGFLQLTAEGKKRLVEMEHARLRGG